MSTNKQKGSPDGSESKSPNPEQSVQKILADWIKFPRVKIIGEDDNTYTVNYGEEEYTFSKEEMEGEMGEYAAGCAVMEITQTVRQELRSAHGFFLDLDIPPEFREAIIFHELREKEYAGEEDAHQKAVHDEILYITKHFSLKLRKQYLKLMGKERERAVRKKQTEERNNEEISLQMPLNPEEISRDIMGIFVDECGSYKFMTRYCMGSLGGDFCFYLDMGQSLPDVNIIFNSQPPRISIALCGPKLTQNHIARLKERGFNVLTWELIGGDHHYNSLSGVHDGNSYVIGSSIFLDNQNTSELRNSIKKINTQVEIIIATFKSETL